MFQDVSSIGPGDRFPQSVERAISDADVVLALIGPRWATVTDADGVTRLDDPDDYVRLELETALRLEKRVVPVLVDHALLPARQVLPATLAPMVECQAVSIRDESWGDDVDRLWEALGVPRDDHRKRPRRSMRWAVLAAAVVGAALVGALVVSNRDDGASSGVQTTDPTGTEPAAPTQPLSSPSGTRVREGSDGDLVGQVQKWWATNPVESGGARLVTVRVKVTNDTTQAVTIYAERFELRAGGVKQGSSTMLPLAPNSDATPAPGESIIVLVTTELRSDEMPVELLIYGDSGRTHSTITLAS